MTHTVEHGTAAGVATVTLASSDLQATFATGAGFVGCSLRHLGDELLGHADGLAAYVDHGATMGIPLLHPWANRLAGDGYAVGETAVALPADSPLVHRDGNGLPMHGIPGTGPDWQTIEAATDGDAAWLVGRLAFSPRPDVLALFPFPHAVDVTILLSGPSLRISTTVTPTGDVAVPLAYGFHPYLRLPGVPRAEWEVSLPLRRHLRLDARGIPTGETELEPAEEALLGDRTFDDGYDQLAEGSTFTVAGEDRRIELRFDVGYPAAQVYAPADADVICFEPMTAPADALRSGRGLRLAEPGHPRTATFTLTVD